MANTESLDALYWNPGLIRNLNRKGMLATYIRYPESITFGNVTANLPTRDWGTFGLGFTALDSGEIEKFDDEALRAGTFKVQDIAIGLMWGEKYRESISFGVSAKYIQSTIDETALRGFALDIGSIYSIIPNRVDLGLALKNVGPQIKSKPLPSVGIIGFSVMPIPKLTFSAQGDYSIVGPTLGRMGLEYKLLDILPLRLGYKISKDDLNSLNYGIGIIFRDFMSVDYAYGLNNDLEGTNHISLSYHFGKMKLPRVLQQKTHKVAFHSGEVIVLLDLKPQGVSNDDAETVTDLLQTALVKEKIFTVIERNQVEKVLKEQFMHLAICNEVKCAVKIGELLNANKVILGSVGKLEGVFMVNIRAVSVDTGEVEFAESADFYSLKNVRKALDALVGSLYDATK